MKTNKKQIFLFLMNNFLPGLFFGGLGLFLGALWVRLAWGFATRTAPFPFQVDTRLVAVELGLRILTSVIMITVAVFILMRPLPAKVFTGWAGICVAILSWLSPFLMLRFGGMHTDDSVRIIAGQILVLIGSLGSLYTLFYLGRSFSIWPAARGLVINGPYAWVRHPLYVAESVLLIGLGIQMNDPKALGFLAFGLLIQIPRFLIEEKVLRAHFGAAYESYAKLVGAYWPRWGSGKGDETAAKP